MFIKKLLWISIAATTLAIGVSTYGEAQITSTPNGYTMKMKWVKGAKMNYTMTMSTKGVPNTPAMKPIGFTMTVKDVKDGVATVGLSGANMPSGTEIKMNTSGKVVGGTAGVAGMNSGLTGAALPSKPIKVGESWTNTEKTTTPMGEMTVTSKYTLKGVKTVAGGKVGEIAVTLNGKSQSVNTTGDGTMQLMMSDCSLYYAKINQTMSISGAGNAPQKMEILVTINRK